MNTDKKLEQDAQELKGHVEETAGKVFGDDELAARGRADQIVAHAKQAATQAGEHARHLGRNVAERAMHKLGELHERLHEEAEHAARERKASEAGGEDKDSKDTDTKDKGRREDGGQPGV